MDVDKYAPFTSSPLDSSRGRGRRMMFPRLRPSTTLRGWKPDAAATAATTVVVLVSQQQAQSTSAAAEQTPQPQVGGSSNGKK